jgi:hypothetical protein
MDDTDKMCVYEGYNKARDCRVETLVKHEVHQYLSTSEWINAADICEQGKKVLQGRSWLEGPWPQNFWPFSGVGLMQLRTLKSF